MLGSTCPICWGRHAWTDYHEIVGTGTSDDGLALIAELSNLGVSWPVGYAWDDPTARPYGLLRMIDEAATQGLDCSEVAGEWVISRVRQTPEMPAALDPRLPRSA
jgi:hypothetical protein